MSTSYTSKYQLNIWGESRELLKGEGVDGGVGGLVADTYLM